MEGTGDQPADELVLAFQYLVPNTAREWEFALAVPFEAPLSVGPGNAGALVDAGIEIDGHSHSAQQAVWVDPVPAQAAVLASLSGLGFDVRGTRIEPGWLRGMQQDLPFHQVIEFAESARLPALTAVEISFLTGEDGVEVTWQARTDGGKRSGGFYLDHTEADEDEVAAVVAAELAAD
ncbi:sporulation protein [Nocardia sp. NPDC056000]|uniref:sporulation protein n=1 Tax=Nocardia sp. NPDC056000 TaxID=3345674 RepID=UPI0035D741DB